MGSPTLSSSAAPSYGENYKTISGSLIRQELGLLLGAGMSAESGIDIGSEMAKRMLRRAVLGDRQENNQSSPVIEDLATKYPFESISRLLVTKLPYHQHGLGQWLRSKDGGKLELAKPTEAHKRLHDLYRLLPHRFPKMIFTTNFDTLIEDEFGEEDAICITSESLEGLAEAREKDKVAVVHLHGCFRLPQSIVVGEETQSTLEGPIFDLLRGALASEIFVLVGYSLTDTNLRTLFFDVQRIAKTRSGLHKRTFAISPAEGHPGSNESQAGIARAIWQQRDVEHIAVNASQFFTSLLETVDNFQLVQMKQEVATALGTSVETLGQMLESAANPFKVIDTEDLLIYLYYSLSPLEKRQ